jgi:hypothetical protein
MYARVTQHELDHVLQEPDWALELLEDLEERSDRSFDVDKAWNGIWFLLSAAGGAPVDVVGGGAAVSDEDLGYGPARYLAPGEVRQGASHLTTVPFDRLADYFDPAQMYADNIYPAIWNDDHALEYLRGHYEGLVRFFSAAAAAGDAIILWLG